MKLIAPDHLPAFRCIAGKCRHTCCAGWEIGIDGESLPRFLAVPEIAAHVSMEDTPQLRLLADERCPFLNADGLCDMILRYGEAMLCQTCRDHPRFRNFWSDRVELGLGLVCEEAGRLILGSEKPLRLIEIGDDGEPEEEPDEAEIALRSLRDRLLRGVSGSGAEARLTEYLLYRHLPDALYDGRVEARLRFITELRDEICAAWRKTDGSLPALVECARQISYDVEYDDEEKERRLRACEAAPNAAEEEEQR